MNTPFRKRVLIFGKLIQNTTRNILREILTVQCKIEQVNLKLVIYTFNSLDRQGEKRQSISLSLLTIYGSHSIQHRRTF